MLEFPLGMKYYGEMTDEELAEMSKSEDPLAKKELCIRYMSSLKGHIVNKTAGFRKLVDEDAVDEIFQDVFYKLFATALNDYEKERSLFHNFFWKVVDNVIYDYLRKRKSLSEKEITGLQPVTVENTGSPALDPAAELKAKLFSEDLISAMDSFAESDRHYWEAMVLKMMFTAFSEDDLCKITGRKKGTFKNDFYRAKGLLDKYFKENYGVLFEELVYDIADSARSMLVDVVGFFKRIPHEKIRDVFLEALKSGSIEEVCENTGLDEKEVVNLMKKGLNDISSKSKKKKLKGRAISTLESAKIVEDTLNQMSAGIDPSLRKIRSGSLKAEKIKKLQKAGKFMYHLFHQPGATTKKKPVIELLEEKMKEKGITPKDLRKQLKMDATQYNEYVLNEKEMPGKVMEDICGYLGIHGKELKKSLLVKPAELDGMVLRKPDEDIKGRVSTNLARKTLRKIMKI